MNTQEVEDTAFKLPDSLKDVEKGMPPAFLAKQNRVYNTATAAKLAAILNEYDRQVVHDAAQLRTYITNKLVEISGSKENKKTSDVLRALELLGKVSDVGLFVEKSEVTVTQTSTALLEATITSKIQQILARAEAAGNAVPVDAEFTVYDGEDDFNPVDAEFEELTEEDVEDVEDGEGL